MKILITGGAGFLGLRLASALLDQGEFAGESIAELTIADLIPPPGGQRKDARIRVMTGDLLEQCSALARMRFDLVFHLAAAVSSACEADFDLGMRSNVDGIRSLLEALRVSGACPRLVFASSAAVFGGEAALPLPAVVSDATLPAPQSSYGIQKFIGEQLVADYSRRGYIDGRSLRLMTVVVRPGRPNAAASSFLSSIIREPLRGEAAVCAAPLETRVALASPRRTVQALLRVAEADRSLLGGRTAINMPALSVSVREMLDALERFGGAAARARVELRVDPTIERIVGSWPAAFDAVRAGRLGLSPDPDFPSIVEEFLRDEDARRKGEI